MCCLLLVDMLAPFIIPLVLLEVCCCLHYCCCCYCCCCLDDVGPSPVPTGPLYGKTISRVKSDKLFSSINEYLCDEGIVILLLLLLLLLLLFVVCLFVC